MLAAMPAESARSLELLRLALMILSRGRREEMSDELQRHLNGVIVQARQLMDNPQQVIEPHPEAIQLATDLLSWDDFRAEMREINSLTGLSPDRATKILSVLEERIASEG